MDWRKISVILFAVSGASFAAFMLLVILCGANENEMLWRMFSVCMPLSGICLIGGAISAFVDFIGKRR